MSCTTLLVGKNASYDGSTLIARDDDSGHGRYDPKRLVAVSPKDQPRRYRSTLSHVNIELPDDPCAYTIAPDALRDRGILAEAGVSVRNVAMSATETIAVNERVLGADPLVEFRPARDDESGKGRGENEHDENCENPLAVDLFWKSHGEPDPYDSTVLDTGLKVNDLLDSTTQAAGSGDSADNGPVALPAPRNIPSDAEPHMEVPGGIGEEDIITLVLPYVHTAREAVQRLGSLLETYGTYEANGISISDSDEVWYVETIGGHHWIARRVPDDCYAAIPNQLGIDDFDLDAALGAPVDSAHAGGAENAAGAGNAVGVRGNSSEVEAAPSSNGSDFMCSADMREFIETNHLDRSMDESPEHWHHINPRMLFGTSTPRDHIYNTPRAWYMQRFLNPSDDWDSDHAPYNPASDDIPWCRVPENKITIEDIHFVLSSHYEDTPYDPYGSLGTSESRHRYRPIGISRTGHLAIMQIRPYIPEPSRSLMWLAVGAQPFTCPAPFYTSVANTPAYLRDTTSEVDTHTLYWTNRLIAVIADAHYDVNSNAIQSFHEDMMSHGHIFVEQADGVASWLAEGEDEENFAASEHVRTLLQRTNQRTSDYLETRNQQLLTEVLANSSDRMIDAFAISDRPS